MNRRRFFLAPLALVVPAAASPALDLHSTCGELAAVDARADRIANEVRVNEAYCKWSPGFIGLYQAYYAGALSFGECWRRMRLWSLIARDTLDNDAQRKAFDVATRRRIAWELKAMLRLTPGYKSRLAG